MTSVIDAVTEQSIIGTDRDGVIRVWNPGAEKMLGLPRLNVVRRRSIVDFHLPEELEAVARAGLAHGRPVGWPRWCTPPGNGAATSATGPISRRTVSGGRWPWRSPPHRRPRRPRRLELRRHGRARRAPTRSLKDQLVSLISHELRTPLSSILGYLELVLDDQDVARSSADQRKYLTTVERDAHRLRGRRRPAVHRAGGGGPVHAQAGGRRSRGHHPRHGGDGSGSPRTPPGSKSASRVPADGLIVPGDAVRLGQACDNLVSDAISSPPPAAGSPWRCAPPGRRRTARWAPASGPEAEPVAQLSVQRHRDGHPRPGSRASCSPASSARPPRSATPSPAWGWG